MKKVIICTGTGLLSVLASSSAFAAITIQAESMKLSNYTVSGGYIVAGGKSGSTGTATATFNGASGKYNITITVLPESDGRPTLTLYRGSTQIHKYTYPVGDDKTPKSYTISGVSLAKGDVIRLVGTVNGGAPARVDKIVFTPVGTTTSSPSTQPSSTQPSSTPASTPAPAPKSGNSLYPTQGSTGGLPVIPGASGFGINTRAGRGGTVYRVTNLNPSGPGSLKACVDASVPRVCIFETSGTINLTSVLAIRNPYITIAGQTAPSPGITIKGAGLSIETHDVLLQHVRVRVGDLSPGPGNSRDAIAVLALKNDVYNVVIDHVSASWSTDELFSTWANPSTSYKIYDITVRNSVFSEALRYSLQGGDHSAGFMIGPGTRRVTVANNILAFNGWRNPLIRDNSTEVMVINNLLYRTRGSRNDQIDFGTRGSQNLAMRASVAGNNFILAPGLKPVPTIYINPNAASDFRMYQKDNLGPLHSPSDPWAVVALNNRSRSSVEAGSPPVWSPGTVVMPAASVEAYALQSAGARPADRDAVDNRVINNIRNRRGDIIDSQKNVGGWPSLAVNRRPLVLPASPNVTTPSGYTNLELWLHKMAREVEGG